MVKPEFTNFFHIIGKIQYAVFLVLGVYFIIQGNVIQKFSLKKTSFTEDVEYVSELPTIMTTAIYKETRSLTYGNDFSITFGKLHSTTYNLTYGINKMDGLPSLRFEPYPARDFGVGFRVGFLITPLSFPSTENLTFELTSTNLYASLWFRTKDATEQRWLHRPLQ